MSTEETSCSCQASVKVILPCSGAADVGELADRAGRKLSQTGKGKMLCLAGIGGNIKGMIASVKGADQVLAIDGCALDCAAKTLREKDITGFQHLRITDLGMEKSKTGVNDTTIARVVEEAEILLKSVSCC